MYKQKNDVRHRTLTEDDNILPARRSHKQLTGVALKEELVLISEALSGMIQLCNKT